LENFLEKTMTANQNPFELEYLKQQATKKLLSSAGEDANKVIALGVKD